MEDDTEDAEERRRKFEAEQAAKNLGAVLGLAAAGVILATQSNTASPEEPDPEEQEEQLTMKGL